MAKAFHRMTLAELANRKVRLLREVRTNGGRIFAAGTEMTITDKFAGLALMHENRCAACGCGDRHHVKRIPFADVELLPENHNVE